MSRYALARSFGAAFLLLMMAGRASSGYSNAGSAHGFYATKTPYVPQQELSSYEPPPSGYQPVFTQMLARHGARALTSAKDLNYIEQLIDYAVAEHALTPLGRRLLPQVQSLEAANVALGYGNLSGLGVEEHQALAVRLLARLPALFQNAVAAGRRVMVVNSGKDRAVDSGNTFAASLATQMPALAPFIDPPISDPGLLYFFATNAAYQDWLKNDSTLHAKLDEILYSNQSHFEARLMLCRLFSEYFIDQLANGSFTFEDSKTGEPIVLNEVDLAVSLYNLYAIAPGLSEEGTWYLTGFVAPEAAAWFAYVNDSAQFYEKGPSFAGSTITFAMAQVLEDDFFNQADANCSQNGALAADLRFAHAETVIPFAALMQLPYSNQQVPAAQTYTYQDNSWRGALVSPYAANIQWDSFSNESGECLVRMLYNEKETRFKPACNSISPGSYFYDFNELKRCYGYEQ